MKILNRPSLCEATRIFVRRVYLDLTGLPAQHLLTCDAFSRRQVADSRDQAGHALIDKLVGSAGLRGSLGQQMGRPACR